MATQPRFKTCFILAPFEVDTSELRRSLIDSGVQWFDQTSFRGGLNWPDAVDSAIASADFVCAVLPERGQGNILFELGIAFAKRKPILAFVGKSTKLPTDLRSLVYLRVGPSETEAIRYALKAFLTHATDEPPSEVRHHGQKREQTHTVDAFISPGPPAIGSEFEERTAALLKEAGFLVSRATERPSMDLGADLAVWIEGLENESLGNPLFVQVKAGNLTTGALRNAALQLRSYVEKTHGRSGLLIYWDLQNRDFPQLEKGWPLIFQLSGGMLTRLIREGRLPEELVRLRNAAVHGEV